MSELAVAAAVSVAAAAAAAAATEPTSALSIDAGHTFAENVHDIVREIPPGRVMTYGDIAAVLGSRASRMVGQVMSRSTGDLPWWRVIRAGGHPPLCHDARAREHYEAEGTPLKPSSAEPGYRVDYRAARWSPPFD